MGPTATLLRSPCARVVQYLIWPAATMESGKRQLSCAACDLDRQKAKHTKTFFCRTFVSLAAPWRLGAMAQKNRNGTVSRLSLPFVNPSGLALLGSTGFVGARGNQHYHGMSVECPAFVGSLDCGAMLSQRANKVMFPPFLCPLFNALLSLLRHASAFCPTWA